MSYSRLGPYSNNNFPHQEQQDDRAVYTNRIAVRIRQAEPLMEERSQQMNGEIRKNKCVTSNHPLPMLVHLLSPDFYNRHDSHEQPYDIQQIKSHTADLPARCIRRHVTRREVNDHDGYHIQITIQPVEPAVFLKDPGGEIHRTRDHRQASKCDMHVHHIQPDSDIQSFSKLHFTAQESCCPSIENEVGVNNIHN